MFLIIITVSVYPLSTSASVVLLTAVELFLHLFTSTGFSCFCSSFLFRLRSASSIMYLDTQSLGRLDVSDQKRASNCEQNSHFLSKARLPLSYCVINAKAQGSVNVSSKTVDIGFKVPLSNVSFPLSMSLL